MLVTQTAQDWKPQSGIPFQGNSGAKPCSVNPGRGSLFGTCWSGNMPWKPAFGFLFPRFALCENALRGIRLGYPGPGIVARKPRGSQRVGENPVFGKDFEKFIALHQAILTFQLQMGSGPPGKPFWGVSGTKPRSGDPFTGISIPGTCPGIWGQRSDLENANPDAIFSPIHSAKIGSRSTANPGKMPTSALSVAVWERNRITLPSKR